MVVFRPPQAALDLLSAKLAVAHLQGFVFFGSANSLGQRLQEVRRGWLWCAGAADGVG
jgi:hypothetical protein